MTVSEAVLEVARRYDIAVEVSEEKLPYEERLKDGLAVFMGCGLSLKERKVWFYEESDIEAQLHELAHVITHPTGCNLNMVRENFLLMQVERELARDMFARSDYERVVRWQRETTVSDGDDLFEMQRPYWLDDELWRDGYHRAREVGLLDGRNRPTYRQAVWVGDPVLCYFNWAKKYDYLYSDLHLEELRSG